jgi:dienelactone hydrolase
LFWRSDISPEREPLKVLLKRGEFIDQARDGRVVPFKVYHPIEHNLQSLPLVLWSHGFGGNKDGASFISRFLASHGYVVAHMTHAGTDSSLWEGKPGHPWDILKQTKVPREVSLHRMKDIPFVLDQLPDWAKENPDSGTIDFSSIGISGHSFGAMTSQAMAGMLLPDVSQRLMNFKEERFRAGILYSPVPIRHLVDDAQEQKAYAEISLPLFHMTGTDDSSPIEGFDYQQRLKVFNGSDSEAHVLILKDGDHMVFNGTRGKLEANPLRPRHEEIIKIAALGFWDMMLKNDQAAREWLTHGGFSHYIAADGEYEYRT